MRCIWVGILRAWALLDGNLRLISLLSAPCRRTTRTCMRKKRKNDSSASVMAKKIQK